MSREHKILHYILFILSLYLFLVSIQGLVASVGFFGDEFIESLLRASERPFLGLVIGLFVTAVTMSSSCTTSVTVGLVSAGAISLRGSIPIIMGANIGTSIVNILVSLGLMGNRAEFKRAFSGAIVHDFFNLFCVMLFFPLEINFHFIEKIAIFFSKIFEATGGIKIASPLQIITQPVRDIILSVIWFFFGEKSTVSGIIGIIIFILLLFFALNRLSRYMKLLIIGKIQILMHGYLFANPVRALMLGLILTSIIQSSAVTTSLVVPLVGAGILTVTQIFPYVLGANLGTTVTAFLAALGTGSIVSVTTALCHFTFNLFGMMVFYPLKQIPIRLSVWFAGIVCEKRIFAVIYVVLFFFVIPILLLLLFN